jgi:hypothetical protein
MRLGSVIEKRGYGPTLWTVRVLLVGAALVFRIRGRTAVRHPPAEQPSADRCAAPIRACP